MPVFFQEHRNGTHVTLRYHDGGGGPGIKIVGPIPDDEHARTLKVALDRLEKVFAKMWLPPREKQQSRGRQRRRPPGKD